MIEPAPALRPEDDIPIYVVTALAAVRDVLNVAIIFQRRAIDGCDALGLDTAARWIVENGPRRYPLALRRVAQYDAERRGETIRRAGADK